MLIVFHDQSCCDRADLKFIHPEDNTMTNLIANELISFILLHGLGCEAGLGFYATSFLVSSSYTYSHTIDVR